MPTLDLTSIQAPALSPAAEGTATIMEELRTIKSTFRSLMKMLGDTHSLVYDNNRVSFDILHHATQNARDMIHMRRMYDDDMVMTNRMRKRQRLNGNDDDSGSGKKTSDAGGDDVDDAHVDAAAATTVDKPRRKPRSDNARSILMRRARIMYINATKATLMEQHPYKSGDAEYSTPKEYKAYINRLFQEDPKHQRDKTDGISSSWFLKLDISKIKFFLVRACNTESLAVFENICQNIVLPRYLKDGKTYDDLQADLKEAGGGHSKVTSLDRYREEDLEESRKQLKAAAKEILDSVRDAPPSPPRQVPQAPQGLTSSSESDEE